MTYSLILTEKPSAAKKIADALADGKAIKESVNKVPYYKITHGNDDYVVVSAVGHLYSLSEKKEGGEWTYPVFDIEWKPSADVAKGASFSKKYLTLIKKLSKDAKDVILATDYDIEGETLGYNIIRFACKKKDAKRMKFSTLTKPDLVKAFDSMAPTINWGQANAGLTRHQMDWFYGINLSRALTLSIKKTGSFKILSSGRVQGPSLKILADREKEIQAFKPVPFWQIELNGDVHKESLVAWHKEDKFWEKEKADAVLKKTKGHDGSVADVSAKKFNQQAPHPFDLTSLQTESYRCFGIAPSETLAIAQSLYTAGYISYPRTSSQQLPKEIGYKKLLEAMKKLEKYRELASEVLAFSTLEPNNGKKKDPAHPAIYPTGLLGTINERETKVYDLIVKRFFATFAEAAVRETVTAQIDVEEEPFICKGTRTVEKGWHHFYAPYVKLEEQTLPSMKVKDTVSVKKITMHEKETQPPKRYTPASIIKELEKRGLGTKSTRAQIVDNLFSRGYLDGKAIAVTTLGILTADILEKYSPQIVDEELTRHFEREMEMIREEKKKSEDVITEAKEKLTAILADFKKKEDQIGKELTDATLKTRSEMSAMGPCTSCKEGTLEMRRGKFGQFVACNKYPDCKTTFKVPANGKVVPAKKECEECKHPMIKVFKKAKKPQELCLNPECPSKHEEGVDHKALEKEEKQCTKCGKPMVLRKSVYGTFWGCSGYPKCKTTEQVGGGNNL